MSDLVLRANRSIALTLAANRDDRARIKNPAFGEIWMHRSDETIDNAVLVGTVAPGQSLVFDYNPTQKTDLVFYLLPKDAVGKENVSRLTDAIKKTFSFESLTAESGTFSVTTEKNFYAVDCTGGASTGNLPPAASCVDWEVTFKKTDSSANTLTLDGDGSETIDGATTYVIAAQYDAVTIKSDGVGWHIV